MELRIEVAGLEPLVLSLAEATDGAALIRESEDALFDYYNAGNRENFESEGGLTGGFVPLNDEYAARKLKEVGAKPVEQYSEKLFRSLTGKTSDTIFERGDGEVTFGSSLDYAAAQNKRNQLIPLDDERGRGNLTILQNTAAARAEHLGLLA